MIEISEYTYVDLLRNNDNVIIYCWAEWCKPCKSFAPIYKETSLENSGIVFCKMNTEEQPTLQNKFNIRAVPTVLFYKKGELRDALVGATTKEDLNNRIKKLYG